MSVPGCPPTDCIRTHLRDPKICALFLADALATGRQEEIASAFREIKYAVQEPSGHTVSHLDMTLSEVVQILSDAELQLVAIRKPQA